MKEVINNEKIWIEMSYSCGNRSYYSSCDVCDKENHKEIITLELFKMSLRNLGLYSFRGKNNHYNEKIVNL